MLAGSLRIANCSSTARLGVKNHLRAAKQRNGLSNFTVADDRVDSIARERARRIERIRTELLQLEANSNSVALRQ
jgi:hypothetical protein